MFKQISSYRVILICSFLFALFYNYSFFKNLLIVYKFSGINIFYTISVFFSLIAFIALVINLLSSRFIFKPFMISLLIISSFVAYFMDTYNIVVDHSMVRNSLETNLNESLDLFSIELVFYVLLFGVIPSFLVYQSNISYGTFKEESIKKLKTIILLLIFIAINVFGFSKFYTSFLREHKDLKYYANPTFWMFGIMDYTKRTFFDGKVVVKTLGKDAKIVEETDEYEKKELVIMVVGEATRADRFSLNGYERETNPLLKKEEIYNLSNVSSCGTATAHSVPCMFSIYNRDDYSYKKGIRTENVLDILTHSNEIKVLWRDNNSDSKGVALRVEYEDYKTSEKNTICENGECRDEGMLIGLDKYIEKNKNKDILIVLHQMGNHGPAYYKRYPKKFEKFTPVCKTNQLEKCTKDEINNAYDNAILHTDSFLSDVINFLKPYSKDYETAMFYMSDHGESLGENGIYLHGMPYFMAPKTQTHVASLMWFGDSIKEELDVEKLNILKDNSYSQDNLFHTLLGLFEVDTNVYKKDFDIINPIRRDKK